ncbi:DNA-directed RNA polymerase subunit beta [Paenibacillaceae bacterium]|nr:DNA-directed RNA polymerase subunit beta [Paenibacillaceae bacterium]
MSMESQNGQPYRPISGTGGTSSGGERNRGTVARRSVESRGANDQWLSSDSVRAAGAGAPGMLLSADQGYSSPSRDNRERSDSDGDARKDAAEKIDAAVNAGSQSGNAKDSAGKAKGKTKSKAKARKKRPWIVRLIFWLMIKSIAPILLILALAGGLYLGYVILGKGSMDDVFEIETWRHMYDLIFSDT